MNRIYEREVDLSGAGANTLLELRYVDASNNKVGRTVVIKGRITAEQIARMEASETDDGFIIPSQVGLPDLQGSFEGAGARWNDDDDHVFHALTRIGHTDAAPTEELSVDEMLAKWPADSSEWKDVDTYMVLSGQAPAGFAA